MTTRYLPSSTARPATTTAVTQPKTVPDIPRATATMQEERDAHRQHRAEPAVRGGRVAEPHAGSAAARPRRQGRRGAGPPRRGDDEESEHGAEEEGQEGAAGDQYPVAGRDSRQQADEAAQRRHDEEDHPGDRTTAVAAGPTSPRPSTSGPGPPRSRPYPSPPPPPLGAVGGTVPRTGTGQPGGRSGPELGEQLVGGRVRVERRPRPPWRRAPAAPCRRAVSRSGRAGRPARSPRPRRRPGASRRRRSSLVLAPASRGACRWRRRCRRCPRPARRPPAPPAAATPPAPRSPRRDHALDVAVRWRRRRPGRPC